MATGAMFVALGGGAYALSGVPDHTGVFHGCVDKKTGALRVVAAASSCRRATTVRRRGHRVRVPGETAIAWSQQGPVGPPGQGAPGHDGAPGRDGAPGSALAYAHITAEGELDPTQSKNVIAVGRRCTSLESCASAPAGKSPDYCFKLGFTPKSATVTTEIDSVKTAARVRVPAAAFNNIVGGCAPGYADAEVFTFDTTTGNAEYAGFYVVFN
jgi:hypothetical protein